jgi:glycolate oxidase iron-sulfur subunit
MQHIIPVDQLGPHGPAMAEAVEKCVHCGFCLATCPTYLELGQEMDSPRGRIVLMKSVLEGQLELEQAVGYVDRCLGCLNCVTACPSGVEYGELLTPFRDYAEGRRARPLADRAARKLALEALPRPQRFRLAARAGRMARAVEGALPRRFRVMLSLLPEVAVREQPLPPVYRAQGQRRARVALLAGCVQRAIDPNINWASLRVLAINGVEVVLPKNQGCCGALHMHAGDLPGARAYALGNLMAFPEDVDAILTNAAGCGSGMQEYPMLFKGTPWEERAAPFSSKVMDISVFLDQLGLIDPPPLHEPLKLVYQDACHLAHAQGVTAPPRALLGRIPDLELLSLPESDLCCGSAGTYNLEQPDIARALGERKVDNILSTGAQGVVSGNIGCMVQIRSRLADRGNSLPVWHLVQVLDRAYRSEGRAR